ncbi:MAG: nucleotidyltransferase family protein [Clostridia bacterium]|nr:nucleotidyltransferase family protein [Clostridia bacterium]
MDHRTNQILFALLRSAICGTSLTEEERSSVVPETFGRLVEISAKHDLVHLLAFGLKQNKLISTGNNEAEKHIFKAVYRYERISHEYNRLCEALENAQIPFIPLKGSVLREYYPEPWMRTSCDIDILVHREKLEEAISYLSDKLEYVEKERATHDVSLFSPLGIHVELHFDLVEEGRANSAIDVLKHAWDNASLCKNSEYRYEMSDAFFYFYHIAHMAKHFETGGCGIRPFIDLWILDNLKNADLSSRDDMLVRGGLLKFANASRTLSKVWFGDEKADELSYQFQDFILHGGVYGTSDNRVALQQTKKGGRIGYVLSRVFIPYTKLKRYYPVLEKYPWLMPFMQVRRWFMLFNPDIAKMAKREIASNNALVTEKADEMNVFLNNIGL